MNRTDLEELGGSLFSLITGLTDRARRYSRFFFVAAAITGVTGLVLGLLATSGGLRIAWLVIGGLFGVVGIGAAYRSWKSLTAILEGADQLRSSVGGLVQSLSESAADLLKGSDVDEMGLLKRANLTRKLRKAGRESLGQYRDVSGALAAIGGFPAVAIAATVSIIGFSILSVVFLIVLAF